MELFPSPTVDANETRYCFFLPTTDTASTDEALHNVAEQQCTAFLSFAAQQTSGFLWHKHRFHLSVSKRKFTTTKVGPYYLSGRTAVGDAIQDEWVVAKLIFQLTKRFPGVIARLADTDGEFLLIESAEALPDWVTPEDSDHRVFIVNGKLHIAPPASDESSRCKEGGFYDEDALEQVLDVKIHTEASTAVQRLIQQKLDETGNSEENKHPDALAADIGVKLTCGLELLYAGDGEDQLRRPWKQTIEELLRKDGAEFSALPVEPDDDNSWLYMHPDTLESQLQQAAMAGAAAGPGGADELQNMAAMFGKFVDGVSGVDGVEGAEPVQFDMSSFMDLLNGQTGGGNAAGLDSPWGEHFMDEDDPSPSDSDDESEEEGDEDLALEKAMAEMEAELAGTKVAKSFSRFEVVENDESEASHEHKVCDDKAVPDVPDASSSPEKPLDLDYNLLSNLLESVASQEGYAGPVSTILSEMNFPKSSV
ncbi:hypothetical protein BBO99_00004198 [Phytophthora kernoviae]|uniref:Uncharacterized protein n=1 Tax=Phytophthora kernoviae TaxID=325452 RepID=A0A421ETK0_9STRA|nr:hypothetical protein JM18_003493 [Phytophthora kernoviae]KAG2526170.1 hypothetical protein JM16_004034 [Phytophthora kernoviae]RLM97659.1 hypothetical protein BBI17_004044 [Phytophthora kernoviae]RLN80845.1 hypothetical protein BBO99_00004198 [Phytophthora kernoviae]